MLSATWAKGGELDRLTQPALGDRASIGVVQADPPGRPGRCHPSQPLPGLCGDLPGRLHQVIQVVDRTGEPTATPPRGRITLTGGLLLLGLGTSPPQRPLGVDQDLLGVLGGGLSQVGELARDPAHRSLGLVLPGRATGA
jgi:hypothetical protein